MSATISIVYVEDEPMMLDGLSSLLDSKRQFSVVGKARDAISGLRLVIERQPDVVITDVELPDFDGIRLLRQIRSRPNPPRVLMLSTFCRQCYVRAAYDSGASGYVLKGQESDELAAAIEAVFKGLRVFGTGRVSEMLLCENPLSVPQRRTLEMVLEGLSTAKIAERLGVTRRVVQNYIYDAKLVLDIPGERVDRIRGALVARERGYI